MRYLVTCILVALIGCGAGGDSLAGIDMTAPWLVVNPSTLVVGPGADTTLQVTAYGPNGTPVTSPGITWSSNAPTIAQVDQHGVVTGVARGSAKISALWQGVTAVVDVMVAGDDLRIQSLPNWTTMVIGAQLQVQTILWTNAGWTLGQFAASWSSSDPTVASVEDPAAGGAYGIVMAKGPGKAIVTSNYQGLKASLEVTVLEPLPYGAGEIEVLEAQILELPAWSYAPIIRVRAGESGADITRLTIRVPGRPGTAPPFCGSFRVGPNQSLDLNVELYGDYQISVDPGTGERVPADSVFQATLQYRHGDGSWGVKSFPMPIVAGQWPTTYSGNRGPIWGICAP